MLKYSYAIIKGPWQVDYDHMVVSMLRPKQNGYDFADDIFKCTLLNEKIYVWIEI